ncbi:hypothetical protein RIF29_22098 [Crotalaria pallida]|uniref:Uncharacterized protein n=1 Tax=Crotalaria pallida TaxID=3830 RepID=A0AAN9FCQ2_CROPI
MPRHTLPSRLESTVKIISNPTTCSTFNTRPSLNIHAPSLIPEKLLLRSFFMGLLDHLWDDTVAGPPPENGLGKLRKHHTFAFRPNSTKESDGGSVRSYGEESPKDPAVRVTRSIMIVKPPGYESPSGSAPASPAGSTPPVSPFSGASRESFRFRRRSTSDAYEKTGQNQNRSSPTSPFDV